MEQVRKNDDSEVAPMVFRPEFTDREMLVSALDYIEAHDLMSVEEERGEVSVRDLRELRLRAEDVAAPMDERKRALLVLAHHRSEAAFTELMRFLERPPLELVGFGWNALDEASMWYLGERRMALASLRRARGEGKRRRAHTA